MTHYSLKAKVDQIVTKEIRLELEAGSEEEAQEKALEALQDYPRPVKVKGIDCVLTIKANYWIPRDITITEIKETGIA